MFWKSARKAKTSGAVRVIVTVFWNVSTWSPVSAVEQPLGGCRVVGGQDEQARHLLRQGENLAGGLGELAPAAHAGNPAALQDVSSVGEIPDEQQRRPGAAADQQRQRAGRVSAGGQH